MICRMWRGWATHENAAAYEEILLNKVIPGIEARKIEGFLHIDVLRRPQEDEVEFVTLMWFDSLESVKSFMGTDYETSYVIPAAQAVLSRFDRRAAHLEVVDSRPQ